MSTPKRLVKWGKPEQVTIGKNNLPMDGEFTYRSKCGRFEIRKRKMSSGNGFWGNVAYYLQDNTTGKRRECDTLMEAKDWADLEIDPNHGA